ncbi:MAG: hypothetical protein ACJAYG_001936 [Oceanicoccus sp.]|jgi:uncharacterized protein YaiL (DUF2058 family)
MVGSLQDQLLKAGLADKKKAKGIKKDKHKQAKQQRKSKEAVVDDTRQQVEHARKEKVERDRLLNQQRKAEADKKAIAAQVKQLIETHRVARDGELDYNFTDQKKIKKVLVNQLMLNQLSRGLLAIVSLDSRYEVVPRVVAEKIEQRLPDRVIVSNQAGGNEVDVDDPYADYQIPDDLMW